MSQQIESQEQALSVLVQAAQLAQKRGAYDLTEAGLISQAVGVFAPEIDSVVLALSKCTFVVANVSIS